MLAGLLLCGAVHASGQPLAAAETRAYSPIPAVDCVINPYRVVDIASPVAGVIENVYVERSQQVAAGEVLAQLEASVERANVELARYRAGIRSEIGLGEVNISFDRQRKKRIDVLLEEQNISLDNADQIEREVQLSKWKLKQARELADIRQLELRRAEEQLRQKSIPAPFDGFVLDTFKYRGEYVEDQAILRLAQLDPLVIEAIVPMENFGEIQPGMQAEILAEVLLKDRLQGEVIAVDRIGDTASNTFGVKLRMPNPDNRIPAGLKCVVKFLAMTEAPPAAETSAQVPDEEPANRIIRTAQPSAQPSSFALISTAGAAALPDADISAPTAAPADALAEVSPVEIVDDTAVGQQTSAQAETAAAASSAEPPLAVLTEQIPSSYMLLVEQSSREDGTPDTIQRLRDAGIDDFMLFGSGTHAGYISLGVYGKHANAVARQQALDRLGFTPSIVERFD
ncbi:MAG: efflux RND transporter periplasmic adaptor subunit [Gammaproteobacteria bacterium]|nr:efflux RND transporter periplasmic adaptor subunit [Gammaproteobacteria bacterium]